MNEKNEHIPDEVLTIIEAELQRQIEAQQAKAQTEKAARDANIEKGRALLAEFVQALKSCLPEWALAYFQVINIDEGELEHAGREGHQGYLNARCLLIIPGLAPVRVVLEKTINGERPGYQIPSAYWEEHYQKPQYYWGGNYQNDTHSLDRALLIAMHQAQEFEALMGKYQEYCEECQQREEAQKVEEQIEQSQLATGLAEENREAEHLIAMLRDDPVAFHLMKAFLAVRQERSAYEERINGMDEELYSTEYFWSQKAADLRRQAEEADRRAQEERSRADDLSTDLDAAQRKIKRGW